MSSVVSDQVVISFRILSFIFWYLVLRFTIILNKTSIHKLIFVFAFEIVPNNKQYILHTVG